MLLARDLRQARCLIWLYSKAVNGDFNFQVACVATSPQPPLPPPPQLGTSASTAVYLTRILTGCVRILKKGPLLQA